MSVAWFPWLSSALVAVLVMRWSHLTRKADSSLFVDVKGAALITLAWHSNVWARFSQSYSGDTIYNLSPAGRAGLILLSSILILLVVYFSQRKSQWLYQKRFKVADSPIRPVAMISADVLLTLLLFFVALTLVPQLYYTYYHLLFDLPQQWVIKPYYSFSRFWHVLRVAPDANLGVHTAGLLGWWLLLLAVLTGLRQAQLSGSALRLAGGAMVTCLVWHLFF